MNTQSRYFTSHGKGLDLLSVCVEAEDWFRSETERRLQWISPQSASSSLTAKAASHAGTDRQTDGHRRAAQQGGQTFPKLLKKYRTHQMFCWMLFKVFCVKSQWKEEFTFHFFFPLSTCGKSTLISFLHHLAPGNLTAHAGHVCSIHWCFQTVQTNKTKWDGWHSLCPTVTPCSSVVPSSLNALNHVSNTRPAGRTRPTTSLFLWPTTTVHFMIMKDLSAEITVFVV